jgi:DNA-binding CsgD family transcriptional regulator
VPENETTPASPAGRPYPGGYWPPAGLGGPPAETSECGLTPREHHVLALVAEGLTNYQIARRLDVSPRTVEKHLEHILEKLSVPSRAAAVAHHAGTRWAHSRGGHAVRDSTP